MLEGFRETRFEHAGVARPMLVTGEGPGVLVMHEVPGITPEVAAFARRVAAEGFRVAVPVLFGTPGKPLSVGYALRGLAGACVSREFHVLAGHGSSPITEWLRALARSLHEECGGPGVGAIGMCLTGNFALALMMEPALMAPVLSQPSLPFPIGGERRAALHVSREELENAKRRCAEGVKVLGLRFTADPMVPKERFDTLRRELGSGFEGIEIDSGPGNAHGIPRTAHSVVTNDLVDEDGHPTRKALEAVLSLFQERLRPKAPRA
ncbi:MAG: dienelactone hydrolase family protein [Myxococcota bacterium]|nr:dienelactone hydrolase family protein [Myxococcota bacterium]